MFDSLILPFQWKVPDVFKAPCSLAFSQSHFYQLFVWSESIASAMGLPISAISIGCLSFLIQEFSADLKACLASNTAFIFLSLWLIQTWSMHWALSISTLCLEHTSVFQHECLQRSMNNFSYLAQSPATPFLPALGPTSHCKHSCWNQA